MLVVIPSAREVRLDYLEPLIAHGCRFVVVDDSPGRIRIDHPQFRVYNWGHQERDLGPLGCAIPRGNGACRDYGFLIAWRESDPGEVVVALDHDCLVPDPSWGSLAEAALEEASRPLTATDATALERTGPLRRHLCPALSARLSVFVSGRLPPGRFWANAALEASVSSGSLARCIRRKRDRQTRRASFLSP